jgi:hypothetical protein
MREGSKLRLVLRPCALPGGGPRKTKTVLQRVPAMAGLTGSGVPEFAGLLVVLWVQVFYCAWRRHKRASDVDKMALTDPS